VAGDYADIPYVQAHSFGGVRETTQVVVIHATDNTANAAGEAAYASRRTDNVSTHFFVDEQQIIQAVPLSDVAYGCLHEGNHRSVQFELCGLSNHLSDATMRRAAPYVRRIADRYGLPLVHLSPQQVAAGVKGICGHDTITAAFPQDHGTHTDPGWDESTWTRFISYVQGEDFMATIDQAQWDALIWRVEALTLGRATVFSGPTKGEPMVVYSEFDRVKATLAGLVASAAAEQSAIGAVLTAIQAGGGSVDAAPILAAIQQVGAAESTAVHELQQQLAAVSAELAAYRHAEAQAARAEAGLLEPPAAP
jgi:hypothetical protein